MEYFIIPLTALAASALTLFSGFGLGTLLLPAFLLFFPADLAVAMTALVHFTNNLFKLVLLGRFAAGNVVLRFGVPAVIAAFAGAAVLGLVSDLPPLARYAVGDGSVAVLPVKVVMGVLIAVFAILEILPSLQRASIHTRYLPLGGVLSGFFGGLSGHQGALRSVFLLRTRLSKEAFIATGVVIACLVDATRLAVYAGHFAGAGIHENIPLITVATLAAFLGAFLGSRLVRKVTMRAIQMLIAALLFIVAAGLASGIL